jgi:hypothetical protein
MMEVTGSVIVDLIKLIQTNASGYVLLNEFYKKDFFSENIGKHLSQLRKYRWRRNYGVPDLSFLIDCNAVFITLKNKGELKYDLFLKLVDDFFKNSKAKKTLFNRMRLMGLLRPITSKAIWQRI